jgi:fructuronate reductase
MTDTALARTELRETEEPRMSPRLSLSTLRHAQAKRFSYERSKLRPRIVHLGLGAFFRAHGALYNEDVLDESGGDWGIVGASLRQPDPRDRLRPQDFLYSAVETGPQAQTARIVGCLLDAIVAPENPTALLDRLADPLTAIVTLTITEKGYCHDPASGRLNADHPQIRHDLEHPEHPQSAVGLLAAALARRFATGSGPFTIATCDNLPGNGHLLRHLVRDFASLRSGALSAWIETHVCFPSSMVDRIVPAQTDEDTATAERLVGLRDEATVRHEPFRQWVLEDNFGEGARPAWELAGVQFVSDVQPFENAKLRMLNGSHSALAYLGYLSGFETIAETVGVAAFADFVRRLWRDEVIPALPHMPGLDLDAYARQLLERYQNRSIRHRTWQIAMDGSQKLPQRLLSSVRDNLRLGRPIPCLALAIAAWMRYVGGIDEKGSVIDVRDPLAKILKDALSGAGASPSDRVAAVLGLEAVFGTDLPRSLEFKSALISAYTSLVERGAMKSVASLA